VTFLGAQNQELLPYYYSASDIVVMPSHYESFGMVALEALASGTPVIASNVGGLRYIVNDGKSGFLVPPRSPETVANRIRDLVNDPALRRKMGENGVRTAQRFSWPAVTSNVESVYEELIHARAYNALPRRASAMAQSAKPLQ